MIAMAFIVYVALLGWPPGTAVHPAIALWLLNLRLPKFLIRKKKHVKQ
jgi:hypothetical protein